MTIVVCVGAHAAGPEIAAAGTLAPRHPVVALSAGTADESAGLRSALDAGASRAVRIDDQALAQTDFHTLGQTLAEAVRHLGGTLVLTAARDPGEGLGAVPAAIAERLGATFVAGGSDVEILDDGRVAVTVRSGGMLRRLALSGTAVVQLSSGRYQPSPVTARATPIEVITLEAIGLSAGQVRRRDHLLGTLEPVTRPTVAVQSAADLLKALGV